MDSNTEILVEQAKSGNNAALEMLIRKIQDRVYGLAIRMLWHPEDAQDATQEILIKVITHLGTFRGESKFKTWVYRIASNHLLKIRKCRAEREEMTFDKFEEELHEGLADSSLPISEEIEQELLVEEIKIGCMQGMLLCLDRDHRVTYILGEIFEVTGDEGSYILNITPGTFRKRLSRARQKIRTFMQHNCGLVSPINSCSCNRQTVHAIRSGRFDSSRLMFINHPSYPKEKVLTTKLVQEMDELERSAALFRTYPDYMAPDNFVENIKTLIDSGNYRVL